VSIQVYTINRDPKLFYQAETFLPERWLPEHTADSTSPFFNDRRDAVQSFSMGPRGCMGQHLAWAEMQLILASLVWRFDLKASGKQLKWEDLRTFLLVEKKPVEVRISPRKIPHAQ
jgi:cytochrome P450